MTPDNTEPELGRDLSHSKRLGNNRSRRRPAVWIGFLLLGAIAGSANALPREQPTVDALKAMISAASVRDKPHLCIELAQMQLAEADKQYAAADSQKAQADLTDVATYSELARDYAIESHKYQKQSEIAVRLMARKLNDLLHSVGHDDQAPIKDALGRLERVRDDLLASMFKKGVK